jgi:hypothetical protein
MKTPVLALMLAIMACSGKDDPSGPDDTSTGETPDDVSDGSADADIDLDGGDGDVDGGDDTSDEGPPDGDSGGDADDGDADDGDADGGPGIELPEVPNMIFQTGFEAGTTHVFAEGSEAPCTDDLLGVDESVDGMGNWESDLEGGMFGQAHFCFGGGTREQRAVNLVADPEDPSNQVLHTMITEPNENVHDEDEIACNGDGVGDRKARIQHVLIDNPDVSQFDYRVRLRLGDGFQALVDGDSPVTWMTIGEFWNNQSSEENSFRVTLNLVKEEGVAGAPLHFGIKSDSQDEGASSWDLIWEVVSEVEVPIGEWFILEVSLVEGDATTGRSVIHVTTADGVRHEVADQVGWTHSPSGTADGFKDINTMKLYTSGTLMCALKDMGLVLEAWWDDYAIGAL